VNLTVIWYFHLIAREFVIIFVCLGKTAIIMLEVWGATLYNQVPGFCALPSPPPYQIVMSGCKMLTEYVPERQ